MVKYRTDHGFFACGKREKGAKLDLFDSPNKGMQPTRYARRLMLSVRAGGISLHPDQPAGLLSAIPFLLKLPSLRASPGGDLVWRKHPAGGKLKKLCYGFG